MQEEVAAKRCAGMVGDTLRVLVEEVAKNGTLSCRTGGNIVVEVDGPASLVGSFAQVRVTEAKNWILKGTLA